MKVDTMALRQLSETRGHPGRQDLEPKSKTRMILSRPEKSGLSSFVVLIQEA